MIVLRVGLEMLGEVDDPLGEDRDLDFGAAGITLAAGVLGDDLRLAFGGNRHSSSSFDIGILNPRTTLTSPSNASTSATGTSRSIARWRPGAAAIPISC